MIAYYADINVHGDIINGLRLRGIDILRGQDDGYDGRSYPDVIDRATELGRVLFSHDQDMMRETKSRLIAGIPFSGIVYADLLKVTIGICVTDLEYMAKVGMPDDFVNQLRYLPVR